MPCTTGSGAVLRRATPKPKQLGEPGRLGGWQVKSQGSGGLAWEFAENSLQALSAVPAPAALPVAGRVQFSAVAVLTGCRRVFQEARRQAGRPQSGPGQTPLIEIAESAISEVGGINDRIADTRALRAHGCICLGASRIDGLVRAVGAHLGRTTRGAH